MNFWQLFNKQYKKQQQQHLMEKKKTKTKNQKNS